MMRSKKIWSRFWILVCVTGMLLCGCGEEETKDTNISKTQAAGLVYEESDFAPLPDEEIVSSEGVLEISTLQRDREGNLAMYIPERNMEEGEYYQQVTEYVMNKEGRWQRKDICEKSLTKRVMKAKGSWVYSLPYVIRGDDGELYVLLQMDWPELPDEEGEKPASKYSVLQLDEEQDRFYEVSLRLDDKSLEGIDTSPGMLTKFHVLEDGTLFFVFGNRTAVQFDADSGAPTAVSENVPDSAFTKNVGYGEKEFVYYSSANKLLNVLDLETLTVSKSFGEEIEEGYRKREWYFDTDTQDWSMYGFNSSGLYTIRLTGRTAAIRRISKQGVFDSLDSVTLYDVQVDKDKNVYVLLRKKAEDSYDYQNMWDFGVAKFTIVG